MSGHGFSRAEKRERRAALAAEAMVVASVGSQIERQMQIPRRIAARDDTKELFSREALAVMAQERESADAANSISAQLLLTCHSEEPRDEESAF